MVNQERDKSIDVLRAIALTGMIIIHISPTIGWIREIRNFDVPLMVFLSGVSYTLSSGGGKISYTSYLFKRFQRLILPTWVFLVLYYVLFIAINHAVGIKGILGSALSHFTFMTGWYVWIMRLFFIVALFAPLLSKVTKSFRTIFIYSFIIGALVLNEFFVLWIGEDCLQDDWRVILEMNIPYLAIFCIGTFILKMPKTSIMTLLMCSLVAFATIAFYLKNETGVFQSLQIYKYPPQAYYMTYGITVTLFLWITRKQIVLFFDKIKVLRAVEFIGSHTMWIYFWHIFLIVFIAENISSSAIRFLVVFIFACLFGYLQSIVLNIFVMRCKKESTKKMLFILFNG